MSGTTFTQYICKLADIIFYKLFYRRYNNYIIILELFSSWYLLQIWLPLRSPRLPLGLQKETAS